MQIIFSEWIFNALVLIVTSGISAHICFGYGTLRWREAFLFMLMLVVITVQLYHLILASLYFPSHSYFMDRTVQRRDCLISTKGGKRSRSLSLTADVNPCFCFYGAQCFDNLGMFLSANNTCPFDGSAICKYPNSDRQIDLYINYERNCNRGEGSSCTKSQPCDPCERSQLPIWKSGRCRSCTSDYQGRCDFVPEVGPYCWEKSGSKRVVPCTTCCTESTPFFVNGTCF